MIYKILLPLALVFDYLVQHPVEAIFYLLFLAALILAAGSALQDRGIF